MGRLPPVVVLLPLPLLLLGAAGCGLSQRLATARYTPCKPNEVEVSERQRLGKDERWVATCPAGRFECEAIAMPDSVYYRCRPLTDAPTP